MLRPFLCLFLCSLALAFKFKLPLTARRASGSNFSTSLRHRQTALSAAPQLQTHQPCTPAVNRELTGLELCLCGAAATICGDLAMHPVDTIKITQQTAAVAKGMLGTARDIVAVGGIGGLYHGLGPYLLADGLAGAIKFAAFELSSRHAEKRTPVKYHSLIRFLCAALAMIACSFVLVPGEVLKTRLQAGAAGSIASVLTEITRAEGLRGLYVGYAAQLVRDVPYTMLELGLYENIKAFIKLRKRTISNADELVAAAVTGSITAVLTTPLDLIKTRLMMQSAGGGKYAGVLDALMSICREGGAAGLFVGCQARLLWLLPFSVIYLGVYEAMKRKFLQRGQAKE